MTLGDADPAQIIVACLLLILALCVLWLGVWYYRRRWMGEDAASGSAWTLEDIRRLRDRGELTEEEYQRMRAVLIRSYTGRDVTDCGAPSSGDGSQAEDGPGFDVKK